MLRRIVHASMIILALETTTNAATINWNPGNGQWNDTANWSPAQIPTALDDVFIDNNTTATASSVNVNSDANANTITLDPDDTLIVSNTATLTTNAIHANGPNGASAPAFTADPGTNGSPGATVEFFNTPALTTPTLDLSGGNGGSGGSTITSTGNGGHGGHGGTFVNESATTFTGLNLDLSGGNGGNGGSGTDTASHAGHAGHGSSIDLAAPSITTFDSSTINLSGGNGGNGGNAIFLSNVNANGGNGGNAGNAGNININGGTVTLSNTTVLLTPGTPGTGGTTTAPLGDNGSNGSPGTPGQVTLNTGSLTLQNASLTPGSLTLNGGTLNLDNTTYNPATTTFNLAATTTIQNNANLTGLTNLQISADTTIDNTTVNVPGQINNNTDNVHLQIQNGAAVTSADYLTGGDLTIDGITTSYTTGITNSPGDNTRNITVSNGAELNTTATSILFEHRDIITIQDPSSRWDHNGAFTLQESDLTIANGAVAISDTTNLGFNGDVVVQDPGSHWFPGTLTFELLADVTVRNGATLQTSGTITIESESSSLTVTGPDSVWASIGAATLRSSLRALNQGLIDIIGQLKVETDSTFQIATNATVRAQTIRLGTDNEDPDDPITTLSSWSNGTLHLSHPTEPVHIGGAENALNTFPGKLTLAANRTLIVDSATTPIDLPGILTLNGGTLVTNTLDLPSSDALNFAAGTLQITHPDPTPIGPDLAAPTNAMPPHTTLTTGAHLITDAGTHLTSTGILSLQGGTLTTPTLTRDAGSILNLNTGTLHVTGPMPVNIGGTQTDPNVLPPVTTLGPDMSLIVDASVNILPDSFLIIAGGNYTATSTTVANTANIALIAGTLNLETIINGGNVELSPATTTNITPGTLQIASDGIFSADGTLNAQAVSNEGTLNTFAGILNFAGNATNDIGAEINAINATLTFPGDGIPNDDGLVNQGTLNLINTTINGDVRSTSNSTINTEGATVFNGLVAGAADFTGAGLVTFKGGYSPGDSTAAVSFDTDLALGTDNKLILELAGNSGVAGVDFDFVNVDGSVTLSGELAVDVVGSFIPEKLDSFTVLSAAVLDGAFDNVAAGGRLATRDGSMSMLVNYNGVSNSLVLSDFMPHIAGDFDFDGDVDGVDFLIWQRGQSPNPLSPADLSDWQSNFGSAAMLIASSTVVPEPSSLILGAIAVLVCISPRRC